MKEKENIAVSIINLFGATGSFLFTATRQAIKNDYKKANNFLVECKEKIITYKNKIEEQK